MIEYDCVARSYGRKRAVDDLTMEVRPGEMLALLGPNGAGKTTTIRMTVGLLRPTSGTVRVCGIDVARRPREATALLGYVPDHPFLYDKLSGRELLLFVGELRGFRGDELRQRVEGQIEQFELAEFADDLTETYSHGMKQRTAFASALLHDPPVLVVDEPMIGLDPLNMRRVKDLLHERARSGRTVFLSTHTLDIVEEIADRIGVFHRGKLLFLGTLDEMRRPSDDEAGSLERLYLSMIDRDNQQRGAAAAEGASHRA